MLEDVQLVFIMMNIKVVEYILLVENVLRIVLDDFELVEKLNIYLVENLSNMDRIQLFFFLNMVYVIYILGLMGVFKGVMIFY